MRREDEMMLFQARSTRMQDVRRVLWSVKRRIFSNSS